MRKPFVVALLLLLAFGGRVEATQPCHQNCPPPPPVAMGRLYTSGFEAQDFTFEGFPAGGSLSVDTSIFRTGAASLQGGRADVTITMVTARDYYARAYIYIPSGVGFPASATRVLSIWDNGGNGASVLVNTDGTLIVKSEKTAAQVGAATGVLDLSTWYRVELHVRINTSTNDDTVEMRLEGTTIVSTTTADLGATAPAFLSFGMSGTSANVDDVALNDDQGANQNSWPGPGAVVLLKPTAMSAVGTGWTDDNASSTGTNVANALNNTPPKGIADTTSGGGDHQDRNATSNANSNLDATMTTYTAAGIPAGSTINVIDPITITGAPVTTSSKQGTVGVASNPAITNIALGAGGTSGAFWSGTAAGTYPSGWKISHGTITYAPSVTLGTAPVMRVTQVTSSTRIAMVCFMGMYVDYTPPGFNIITGLNVGQAVNRASTY